SPLFTGSRRRASAFEISLDSGDLLPGAPTLTGAGLAPAGEAQLDISGSIDPSLSSRRTMAAPYSRFPDALRPALPFDRVRRAVDAGRGRRARRLARPRGVRAVGSRHRLAH